MAPASIWRGASPAHTFVNVSQLAWPAMLVEIDAIAIVPQRAL